MPGYGQKSSIGASSTPLVASATLALTGVRIKALAANSTGIVYVGNTTGVLTTTGYPLAAGEECSFDAGFFGLTPGAAADLQNIFLIGSTTGLAVAYWYV